jgi:DNA-binding transcriptional LysR family regulator
MTIHMAAIAEGGPTGITYPACLAAGFEPRIVHLSDHAPITQGLVAAGLGVTLVSSLSVPQARKDIAIRPLKPSGPERDVYAVSLPGALQPPAITAMVEILRELAPRYEPARKSAAVRPSSVAAP